MHLTLILGTSYKPDLFVAVIRLHVDRIMCVLVRIKVRGYLAVSIIQFMNLISVHFWTYLERYSEVLTTVQRVASAGEIQASAVR